MLFKSILPLALSLLSVIAGSSPNLDSNVTNTIESPTVEQYNLDPQINRSASGGTYSIFETTNNEIEDLVANGTLASFHLNYYKNPYYQIPYLKFKKQGMLENYWYSKFEEHIQGYISMYSVNSRFFTDFNKRSIPR